MRILDTVKNSGFVKWIKKLLQSIELPGMNGISLYELLVMYINGIRELQLGNRAAAISWRLFISLFPFMMFFFLLIQNLPYYHEIEQYFYSEVLDKILPSSVVQSTWEYISERNTTITDKYGSSNFFTLFIGVIIFLVTSTQGINSLVKGLNFADEEDGIDRNRNGIKQYSSAIYLTFLLTILLVIGLLTVYYVDVVGNIFIQQDMEFIFHESTIELLKYLIFAFIFFIGICAIYYIGPDTKLKFKQITPGALLTTILFLMGTFLFSFFIANFSQYNILYGSLGTILIIMLLLNISVILVILGYQLNLSIIKSKNISENESH